MAASVTSGNALKRAIEEHKKGNFAEAELLYRQTLETDPNNVEALHYLGLICMEYGRYDVARDLINRAKRESTDANLAYNLGLCHQQLGQIGEAMALYKEALTLAPHLALAHNNLGVCLQQQGNYDDAKRHFQQAIVSNPGFTEAFYNFAFNEKFKSFPDMARQMLQQLESGNSSDDEKRKLHFALGKIYDDIGDFDEAFLHFDSGNKLKNAQFNIHGFQNYVNSLTHFFTEKSPPVAASNPYFRSPPVFIVGMPRSGTTLTEQILAGHPQVTAGGELGLIGDIVDRIPELFDSGEFYPNCLTSLNQHHLDAILADSFLEISRRFPHFQIITDKTPVNFLHIGLIKTLFPDAKVIHCLRDPIDTCLSCYFQDFNRQHAYSYDLKTLGEFYNCQQALMGYWKRRFPDIYTLEYEQLVADPEGQARALVTYCGLDWSDDCLQFHTSIRQITTASVWQARQPIYLTSVKRWKNYEKYLGALKDVLVDYENQGV